MERLDGRFIGVIVVNQRSIFFTGSPMVREQQQIPEEDD
jgi:hypothetical protein